MTILPGRRDAEQFSTDRDNLSVTPATVAVQNRAPAASAEQKRLADLLQIGWTYRSTIAASAAVGLLCGWFAAAAMGPSYTAVAVLRPNLFSEVPDKGSQAPNLDANQLLESEVELILTQSLSPTVAAELNRQFPPDSEGHSILSPLTKTAGSVVEHFKCAGASLVRSFRSVDSPPQPCPDRTAALNDLVLSVTHRNRTYLIEVSLSASTPERAAAFANAIATQYGLNNQLKQFTARITAAREALAGLLVTYGDRHPLVRRARGELAQLTNDQEVTASGAASTGADAAAAETIVVRATASAAAPNSHYKSFAIWTLLGLMGAVGLILFKEGRRFLKV